MSAPTTRGPATRSGGHRNVNAKKRHIDEAVLREYRDGDYAAIYVAGPGEVVPKRMGDNRGARPIRIGITKHMTDEVVRKMDDASPTFEQRILIRLWVRGHAKAKRLEALIRERLGEIGEHLRKSYTDMGPDFDVAYFELELRYLAEAEGIETYDDETMMRDLARRVKKRMARVAEGVT